MNRNIFLYLLILVILAAAFFALKGIPNSNSLESKAQAALTAQGYQVLEARGYEFFACGEDAQGYNFAAINPAGVQVNVTACTENGFVAVNKSWWIVTR